MTTVTKIDKQQLVINISLQQSQVTLRHILVDMHAIEIKNRKAFNLVEVQL